VSLSVLWLLATLPATALAAPGPTLVGKSCIITASRDEIRLHLEIDWRTPLLDPEGPLRKMHNTVDITLRGRGAYGERLGPQGRSFHVYRFPQDSGGSPFDSDSGYACVYAEAGKIKEVVLNLGWVGWDRVRHESLMNGRYGAKGDLEMPRLELYWISQERQYWMLGGAKETGTTIIHTRSPGSVRIMEVAAGSKPWVQASLVQLADQHDWQLSTTVDPAELAEGMIALEISTEGTIRYQLIPIYVRPIVETRDVMTRRGIE
jgi:hypothetical protein